MLFEDKTIDSLTSDDLSSLMSRDENQRLDFKREYEPHKNLEIARDICSFANADGGYIIVGACEDNSVCVSFVNVESPETFCQRIRQIALDCISERIEGIRTATISLLQPDDEMANVVIIYVPNSSRKPHMVKKDNKSEFWRRYEKDKRIMTISEIRETFIQNIVMPYDRIEAKVDRLIHESRREFESQITKDESRLNEIQDKSVFLNAVDGIYEKEMNDRRFFRLTITPDSISPTTCDVSDS